MHWMYWVILIVLSFVVMEGITWATHKYVMHGFLWYLHEDHHQPSGHVFEKNDAFFLIFAVPSWLMIHGGWIIGAWWLVAIGFGVAAYGFAYFVVHEVIIHQRLKWFSRSNNTYVRALRWSHKMHHKHLDKAKGESFGLLYIHKKYWEKVRRDKTIQRVAAS